MIGNFQGSGNYSKIQYGAAWWFNDNYDGMRKQLATLANLDEVAYIFAENTSEILVARI